MIIRRGLRVWFLSGTFQSAEFGDEVEEPVERLEVRGEEADLLDRARDDRRLDRSRRCGTAGDKGA